MGALKLSYYHKVEEGHQVVPIFNLYPLEQQHAALKNRVNCSPFGVTLHGRDLSLSTTGNKPYRYGFQNQEFDTETGLVNFEFRMYDPKVGRFFKIDPLTGDYPYYTPYSFSGNKVIAFTELEGKEENQSTNVISCGKTLEGHPTVWINNQGGAGNLFIQIAMPIEFKEVDPAREIKDLVKTECLLQNTNFDYIFSTNLNYVNEAIAAYMSAMNLTKLNTVVFNDHGNSVEFRLKYNYYDVNGEFVPGDMYVNVNNFNVMENHNT